MTTRYRCGACGNLTRFDVVTDRRTRAFFHYSVGGELAVEDEEVLWEATSEVRCRWCGHGRSVEMIDQASAPAGSDVPPEESTSHAEDTRGETSEV